MKRSSNQGLAGHVPGGNRGFSLMEILAAISVLLLIGLMIAQLTTAMSNTTRVSNRSVDAAGQARLVLDRIGLDLDEAVKRTDTDFWASNSVTDGCELDFLTQVASADPASAGPGFKNRGLSRVNYHMEKRAENGGRLSLLRGTKAVGWGDRGFMGLKTNGYPVLFSDPGYPVTLAAEDYDVLSPSVLRMVVGFQLVPDNRPVVLADGTNVALAQGQITYSPPVRASAAPGNKIVDLQRVASLVVGLVVVDLNSLKLLDGTAADALTGSFATTIPAGRLPVGYWMQATSSLGNLPSAVPLPVRQAVRVYQRFYPVNPYGSPPL